MGPGGEPLSWASRPTLRISWVRIQIQAMPATRSASTTCWSGECCIGVGKCILLCPVIEPNRSVTSILLSVQSGSISTDQGQGYGQMRPSQVTVSEISSAQRLRSASHSSVYTQFSTMAWGREIVPVGEAAAALYDDTSMNGSNGPASP